MYSAGHADIMKHKKDVGGESMLTLDMVREAQEALRGDAPQGYGQSFLFRYLHQS